MSLEIPYEIRLSIIETGKLTQVDLTNLSLTCSQWAELALPLLWESRNFLKNHSLQKFINTLSNSSRLFPYGDYIKKIIICNPNKEPQIIIDEKLIKFIADYCPNLKELTLAFPGSYYNSRPQELPLKLLGDRLIRLTLEAYEHVADNTSDNRVKPIKSKAQLILDKICDDANSNDITSNNLQDNNVGSSTNVAKVKSKAQLILDKIYDETNNNGDGVEVNVADEQVVHDALCEAVRLGNICSIRLYYPDMPLNVWENFAQSAGNSLTSIRIIISSLILTVISPSDIVRLFGEYCRNLRNFDIQHFDDEHPIPKSVVIPMLQNCQKLSNLDILAASDVLSILHLSKSLTSVYFSGTIQGSALKVEKRMENLRRLSFLRINGKCNFSFLGMFPNIRYLSIGDFAQVNDDTFCYIGKTVITELELVKTQSITDKALRILSSMSTLVKFSIRDRLHNVTQDGWLSFAKRMEGCPSWVKISIDDGRQIHSRFFEILDREHPKLEVVNVKGLNRNLNSEEIMQTLKFSKASEYYKGETQLRWPIRYKHKPVSYVQRNVFKDDCWSMQ